jgi:hypothetical protein
MSSAQPEPGTAGTGLPLERFGSDARALSAEDFAERHGDAFLLLSAVGPRVQKDTFSTHLELEGQHEGHTGTLATLVYPLRSKIHILTVGRARDNDVIVTDRSVSRHHARMKRLDGGGYLVLDAGSSNGTSVNGRNVLAQGAGPPTPLSPGDTLRLGSLEFTFAHAAGLRELAARGSSRDGRAQIRSK